MGKQICDELARQGRHNYSTVSKIRRYCGLLQLFLHVKLGVLFAILNKWSEAIACGNLRLTGQGELWERLERVTWAREYPQTKTDIDITCTLLKALKFSASSRIWLSPNGWYLTALLDSICFLRIKTHKILLGASVLEDDWKGASWQLPFEWMKQMKKEIKLKCLSSQIRNSIANFGMIIISCSHRLKFYLWG